MHDSAGESNKLLRQAYDQVAERFAEINRELPPVIAEMGGSFLAKAGHAPRILDIGCGHGRDVAWLDAQGARPTGVDLSWGMLQQARKSTTCPLAQMDMRLLAFPDATFDGAWCMASLLHLSKKDMPLALREIRRVVKAGAPLLVALQEGSGEGWETGSYLGDVRRFFARYSREEAEKLLEGAGFKAYERGSDEARGRRWLQFLDVAA